jgi:serine/threonine-protein kinase
MTDQLDRLKTALADRYTIEHELGAGGMATVYLAHDVKHNRKVAVKVLRPELSAILGGERFLKEIEVTANLQHPNILPLYDSGEADSFLYYVMPYVEGESLRDVLNREKQLPVDDAVEIARAVAGALDFAHQRGVIHRDIKPENILLQAGQALVADFGIALALSAAGGGTRLTETGLSIGTPHYMSPEQASADRELDGRTDLYSLGAVLYEMLAGQPLFVAGSAQAIVAKILTETPVPVSRDRPTVPPHVDAAINMSLAKLPADRFTSAAAFSAALVNPAFTVADTAIAQGAAVARGSAKTRASQWILAVGLVAIGLGVGLTLQRGGEDPPDVVRFYLTTPSGHRLAVQNNEDAPFAISPDGQRIVYAAIDSGAAVSKLYIRAIDQIDGVALPGTEDAIAPFFSPDGLWVGFATEEDEKLKKVPVTGGPPITLADDVQNLMAGASWGDDGYIVYASSGFSLSRVSGAGGVLERIADESGVGMFWPSVLPGGQAVLFERCNTNCTEHDLAVLDVASGLIEVLVPGATRGWYANSGHLVYATDDGAVYGVPFDPRRREVTGSPVPLLDGVRGGLVNGSRLSVSASGAMIYLPGSAGTGVQVVEVDRSGGETVVISRVGQYEHPRWSPDGERIAMTVSGESGAQIWIYDIASETLSQLTFEGRNVRPTWSPDGSTVAFYSQRDGSSDLYWKPADGSGPAERVAEGEDTRNQGTTFWTRDGSWIVFDGLGEENAPDENIYAVGTGTDRTRQPAVATGADEQTGAVSPNGEWLAYGSDESGPWQIYVRRFLEPGGRWLVSTGGAGTPLWASDTEVVYRDYTDGSLTAARLEFGSAVRVVERTRLFDFRPFIYSQLAPMYDVSRDGQSFLVLRGDQDVGTDLQPIVVLNWFEEIKRRMAEQGGR